MDGLFFSCFHWFLFFFPTVFFRFFLCSLFLFCNSCFFLPLFCFICLFFLTVFFPPFSKLFLFQLFFSWSPLAFLFFSEPFLFSTSSSSIYFLNSFVKTCHFFCSLLFLFVFCVFLSFLSRLFSFFCCLHTFCEHRLFRIVFFEVCVFSQFFDSLFWSLWFFLRNNHRCLSSFIFSPLFLFLVHFFLYLHSPEKLFSFLVRLVFSFFVSLPEQQTISFLFLFFLSFFELSLSLQHFFLQSLFWISFFFPFFLYLFFPLVHSSHSSPSPFICFFFCFSTSLSSFRYFIFSLSLFFSTFFFSISVVFSYLLDDMFTFFSLFLSLFLPLRLFSFISSTFRCLPFSLLPFFSLPPSLSISHFRYLRCFQYLRFVMFLHLLFLFFVSVPFLFLSLLRFLVSFFSPSSFFWSFSFWVHLFFCKKKILFLHLMFPLSLFFLSSLFLTFLEISIGILIYHLFSCLSPSRLKKFFEINIFLWWNVFFTSFFPSFLNYSRMFSIFLFFLFLFFLIANFSFWVDIFLSLRCSWFLAFCNLFIQQQGRVLISFSIFELFLFVFVFLVFFSVFIVSFLFFLFFSFLLFLCFFAVYNS